MFESLSEKHKPLGRHDALTCEPCISEISVIFRYFSEFKFVYFVKISEKVRKKVIRSFSKLHFYCLTWKAKYLLSKFIGLEVILNFNSINFSESNEITNRIQGGIFPNVFRKIQSLVFRKMALCAQISHEIENYSPVL